MRTRSLRGNRHDEGRGSTEVPVRVVDVVRVELELAVVEVEVRGAREHAVGVGSELVACCVDPEIVVVRETVGVGQEHAPDLERPEAELARPHHDAGALHGSAAMPDAELRLHHKDVVLLLLLAKLLERTGLLRSLLEVLRAELVIPVVVERPVAGLGELREDRCDGFTVRRRDDAPVRDEEVALRPRERVLRRKRRVVGLELGEERLERRELLGGRLGVFVAGEVAVRRRHFLVGELVRDDEVREERDEMWNEPHDAELDEALHGVLVEAELSGGLLRRVFDEAAHLLELTFGCGHGRRLGSHRRILLLLVYLGRRTSNCVGGTSV